VQLASERVERDVDDRRVEDRHDRPDDDDGRDGQEVAIETQARGVLAHRETVAR
jgi:hypothetical protein